MYEPSYRRIGSSEPPYQDEGEEGSDSSEPSALSVSAVVGILRRNVLLIGLVTGLVFALAWWLVPESRALYQANVVVRLADARSLLTGNLDDAGADAARGADFMISQLHVIQSRAVAGEVVDFEGLRLQTVGLLPASLLRDTRVDAEAVADTLHLQFGRTGLSVRSGDRTIRAEYGEIVQIDGVSFSIRRAPVRLEQGALVVLTHESATRLLLTNLRATVRNATNIIDISYSDPSHLRAQRVVNGIAESFRRHDAESVRRKAQSRRIFIEHQLARTDSTLMEAQLALSSFRTRERLYSSTARLAAEQTGLMNLDVRRGELDADRRMIDALLQSVETGPADELENRIQTLAAAPGVAASPVVSGLYGRLTGFQMERERLVSGSQGLSERHPEVDRLTMLIASTQAQLVNAVRSHLASLEARIAALDGLRDRSVATMRELPPAQAEETRLAQNVATINRMADLLRDEYQRASIAEAVEVGNVEILDVAAPAVAAPARSRGQILAFSLVIGLFLGTGCAFLIERRNTSIRGHDELEGLLHIPGLAIIPRCSMDESDAPAISSGSPRGRFRLRNATAALPSGGSGQGPHSSGAEAFRVLRTNLVFSQPPESLRLLVVTSPASGEGKTTTAANLASIFARQGMRVLLVDCDLRRPQLHKLFDTQQEPGFVDLVLGRADIAQAARATSIDGLFVVPRGSMHDDEAEMLGGERVRRLFGVLAAQFDMVIVDSPPLLAGADAASLGAIADGVLMVVRAGRTDRGAAQHALLQLAMVGARVVGSVLNDPDAIVPRYGGSYYQEPYVAAES